MNLIKYCLKILLACFLVILTSSSTYANNEEIIDSTVYYIEKNSYFYEDSAFAKIFASAINSINAFSDEVFIRILNTPNENLEIEVKVDNTNEHIVLKKNRNLIDVGKNLNTIITLLEEKDIANHKNNLLAYHVANAVLQEIDEYSSIIEPGDLNQFLVETKGSFGGIGIVVGIRDEKLTIISPIEGTPASKAGIEANDVIRRIESNSADGITLERAIQLLRGEKGTGTTLYIERENAEDLIKFDIIRDIINIESISSKILENNIGYIKIKSFQSNTFEQFQEAFSSLRGGGILSLILDLRGNPGGLFDQALQISNIFLKNKLIVSTKGKKSNMNRPFFTAAAPIKKFTGPIIVLVDRGSASASEIVAGALKNNKRCLIIGETTFGKGTVQEVYEQNDGSAIKLTIAEYLSPKNYQVHLNGIRPDINFVSADFKNGKLLFDKEATEELLKPGLSRKPYIIYSPGENTAEEDELIEFSQAILNSDYMKKFSFNGNTDNFLSLMENELSIMARKITKSLTSKIDNFKIKNNSGANTNYKELGLKINPEIILDSGKTKSIVAEIKNNSKEKFSNLVLVTNSENTFLNNKYFFVGTLKGKENKRFKMELVIPSWAEDSSDIIQFALSNLSFDDPLRPRLTSIKEVSSDIKIKRPEFIFPKFAYRIVPKNNLDENVELGLEIQLKKIQNNCDECYIKILTRDKNLIIKDKNHKINSIDKKDITVNSNLLLEKNLYSDFINFTIRFHDEVSHSFFDKEISIPFEEINSFVKFQEAVNYRFTGEKIVFSDPSNNAIVLGTITHGNLVDAIGETINFLLVATEDKRLYWAPKSTTFKVSQDEKGSFVKSKIIGQYEEPPSINIETQFSEGNNKIEIKSSVEDATNLKNINYFINEKKFRLVSQKRKSIKESFRVELGPGRNKLSVVAIDAKNIKTFKNFFITNHEE